MLLLLLLLFCCCRLCLLVRFWFSSDLGSFFFLPLLDCLPPLSLLLLLLSFSLSLFFLSLFSSSFVEFFFFFSRYPWPLAQLLLWLFFLLIVLFSLLATADSYGWQRRWRHSYDFPFFLRSLIVKGQLIRCQGQWTGS